MDKNDAMIGCPQGCWLVAVLGGVLGGVLLLLLGGWTFMQAIFAAVVIAAVAGALLSWLLCRSLPAPGEAKFASNQPSSVQKPAPKPVATAPAAPAAEAEKPAPAAPAAKPAAAAPVASVVKPSAPLAGQAELASRKGSWKYGADAAPKKPAPKPAKPKAAAPASDIEESAPELYATAPDGGGDDLKLISGVGPKLEETLNGLGIYRFEQVATWGDAEIAWVDARLRFKGRITRDDWMSQARTLATGGETEFSRKKKKG